MEDEHNEENQNLALRRKSEIVILDIHLTTSVLSAIMSRKQRGGSGRDGDSKKERESVRMRTEKRTRTRNTSKIQRNYGGTEEEGDNG